jgi:hypothetical protein
MNKRFGGEVTSTSTRLLAVTGKASTFHSEMNIDDHKFFSLCLSVSLVLTLFSDGHYWCRSKKGEKDAKCDT